MQGATGSNKVTLLESPAGNKFPQPEPIQEAVQKALIVERGELYTSVIPEGQVFKDTDDAGRRVIKMLTEDQVTAKLRKKEMSYNVGRGRGVVRYDVVQLPSNDPIEDDHAEKIVDVPSTDDTASGSDWMFWGVFDGHSGWTTSAKLRQSLISFVARELNSTYRSASKSVPSLFPSAEAIDDAIKKGFTKLDHEITHESVQRVLKAQSKPLAAELLAPALSGSCALLSFYDSRSKELRVACTGDSRAVLGRRSANGKWTATPLSTDFTGGTESEAARLRAEHPNEPYVTANGRILGSLEPSRAFGDASYKWSLELQSKLHGTYFARRPNPRLKTPPYVTAEPIVTTTQIAPEKGDFVVMATDGLWEMLTNEEVIGLVGMWLEKNPLNAAHPKPASGLKAWLPSFLAPSAALPVEASGGASDASGQRAPIRLAQYGIDPEQSGRFVVDDANAATHLVRNALGGANKDMVSALLTLAAPNSRRYRDDLTVEVIFFGEEGEASRTGRVEVNAEGSKGKTAEGVKAKL
ncbi:protein serine/threonine phosphatase 2C [Myriangium duriaei CBS 260.36]|uniref:Protein serine/threonine phosphatase 2C n=1 Tax=Myriangium duriaei CBS 260.36 TaxID=1168546 RepID=A0A9P4IXS2_9PEZI|nr:protein serine/threonine phosphatase 2C [Myriangium duriaei CBS 260.36]